MNSDKTEIIIRPLALDEWENYKRLRLEALTREPQAFGSSYTDAAQKPDIYWRDRLEAGGSRLLFAVKGDVPVGMVAAYPKQEGPAEQAEIVSMYVTPEERRQGIARMLLESILADLINDASLKTVSLAVNTQQRAAIALYELLGFTIAEEVSGNMGDGKRYTEYVMERPLR
jgi:ribosomal protein S18 acetylase RimI-like enzyme